MSFTDLGLSENTIHAIEDLGYNEPTTVQKDVIPSILSGKDIFTIAPVACGKTCSYIFPLVDIISKNQGQNILIISANNDDAINISDKFSIFKKYHEINEDETNNEANVVIGAPDLLLENIDDGSIDVKNTNILVVDDINLIKKNRQLNNLNKILSKLPLDKQNIVFTTRRSKETQDTLNNILKTPAEIKIDKAKECEVSDVKQNIPSVAKENINTEKKITKEKPKKEKKEKTSIKRNNIKDEDFDKKAYELSKKHRVFKDKTPAFLLLDCKLADERDE